MSKAKHQDTTSHVSDTVGHIDHTVDPTDTDTGMSRAMQNLADDRARRIEELERRIDELERERDARPADPIARGRTLDSDGKPLRVVVKKIELILAPEHQLVLIFQGEDDDLRALKASFELQFKTLEDKILEPVVPVEPIPRPDPSIDGTTLPETTRATIDGL